MDRVIADAFGNCLYCITCEPNGMRYIGRSIQYRHRFVTHLRELKAGRHLSKKMQLDFDSYGQAAFSLKVLGWYLSSDDVAIAEIKAIRYFHKLGKAYNHMVPSVERVQKGHRLRAEYASTHETTRYRWFQHAHIYWCSAFCDLSCGNCEKTEGNMFYDASRRVVTESYEPL